MISKNKLAWKLLYTKHFGEEVQLRIRIEQYLLVVPHAEPYLGFVEYLKQTTWKHLFAYTFIVVVVTSLRLTLSEYLRSKKILLLQRVTDVINLLIKDNGSIRTTSPCRRLYLHTTYLHRVNCCKRHFFRFPKLS